MENGRSIEHGPSKKTLCILGAEGTEIQREIDLKPDSTLNYGDVISIEGQGYRVVSVGSGQNEETIMVKLIDSASAQNAHRMMSRTDAPRGLKEVINIDTIKNE